MGVKGYKGFNKDMTCRGFQYEIGKEYEHKGSIELCDRGFHFCKKIADVQNFYNITGENMEEIIEINGRKIKAIKEKITLYSATSQKEQLLYKMPKFVPKGRRIKYTLPIEIYKEIPEIVHIDNKRFLKSDYIIKSKYFNLIEC